MEVFTKCPTDISNVIANKDVTIDNVIDFINRRLANIP